MQHSAMAVVGTGVTTDHDDRSNAAARHAGEVVPGVSSWIGTSRVVGPSWALRMSSPWTFGVRVFRALQGVTGMNGRHVLYDKETKRVGNNESAEIIRMFETAMLPYATI